MFRCNTERGLSLPELLLASGLALLIGLTGASLFSTLLGKVWSIQQASDRQLMALTALQRLRQDLEASASEGLQVDSTGLSLTIAQQEQQTDSLQRLWLAEPVLYRNSPAGLLRLQAPSLGPPLASPPLLPGPGAPSRRFAEVHLSRLRFEQGRLQLSLEVPLVNLNGQTTPQELNLCWSFSL